MALQAPRTTLDELEEQMQKRPTWKFMSDNKKESPVVRTDVVVGIHKVRSAHDILQAIAICVPSIKPALDRVLTQLSVGINGCDMDIQNLEFELTTVNQAHDEMGGELIRSEARFQNKCDEVERLHEEAHQKNLGFVETIQQKNRESAALEGTLEQLQDNHAALQRGKAEAENYITELLNYITKNHTKHLPAKLRRFG